MIQAIMALLLFAAEVNAGRDTLRSPCIQRVGLFYDELHSFSVDAPPGWCGSPEGAQIVFRPATDPTQSSIRVVYGPVHSGHRTRASTMRDALAAIEPSAHGQQMRSIRVTGVGSVSVFRLATENRSRLFVAAFVFHEEIVIRVVGKGLPQDRSAEAPPAFRHVVQSVRANGGRRLTLSLERTSPARLPA